MKAVLMSIHPKWCEKIFNGEKTIEVRKTAPKLEAPFTVYVYQTKLKVNKGDSFMVVDALNENLGCGKVIGEFICKKIDKIFPKTGCYMINNDIAYTNKVAKASCLYFDDLKKYLDNKAGYAWHITDLKIYDKPKGLNEFAKPCDWNYDCWTCKRAMYELTKEEAKLFYGCDREITRPPQSWQYVEEI